MRKKKKNFQKIFFIGKAVTNFMGIAEALREVINDSLSFIFRNQFFGRNYFLFQIEFFQSTDLHIL